MSRFTAPPPNGDSRKVLEQRSREATRPAAPLEKGRWPFSVSNKPTADSGSKDADTDSAKEDQPK